MTDTLELQDPFSGITEAFAADLEAATHHFKLHNLPCYVEIAPMDASAEAQYRGLSQEIRVSAARARQAASAGEDLDVDATFAPPTDDLELLLLVASVREFQLVRVVTDKAGNREAKLVKSDKMNKGERRQVFASLSVPMRAVLVRLCTEVNHLDPNSPQAAKKGTDGAEVSPPTSTD